jgi:hypothetical protein
LRPTTRPHRAGEPLIRLHEIHLSSRKPFFHTGLASSLFFIVFSGSPYRTSLEHQALAEQLSLGRFLSFFPAVSKYASCVMWADAQIHLDRMLKTHHFLDLEKLFSLRKLRDETAGEICTLWFT